MRVCWLTDLHLDHVPLKVWERFVDRVRQVRPDRLLITGDITESDDLLLQLDRLSAQTDCRIDFVLGNHDYYGGDIDSVRRAVGAHVKRLDTLVYLSEGNIVSLSSAVGLVGVDGWGDTRVGDYRHSFVRLADFEHIADLKRLDTAGRQQRLLALGAECAAGLARSLQQSLQEHAVTIVATHVPPFRESCWYEGKTADDNWAPYFVCGAVGNVLMRFAEEWSQRQIIVLCGHGHHAGVAAMRDNLIVHTGGAEYGSPTIASVLDIEEEQVRLKGADG